MKCSGQNKSHKHFACNKSHKHSYLFPHVTISLLASLETSQENNRFQMHRLTLTGMTYKINQLDLTEKQSYNCQNLLAVSIYKITSINTVRVLNHFPKKHTFWLFFSGEIVHPLAFRDQTFCQDIWVPAAVCRLTTAT